MNLVIIQPYINYTVKYRMLSHYHIIIFTLSHSRLTYKKLCFEWLHRLSYEGYNMI